MNEVKNCNIPSLSVGAAKDRLLELYTNAVQKGVPLHRLPTPFFWGAPGVGKSQAVRQLAEELESTTGKTVTVTDVRLLLFSPVDLRGVPVADTERAFCKWLMPKIFDMVGDDTHLNILFLDELSAAPQSVQAAAYQIALDRRIGEHVLPENCIVIAAGNRTTDQSVSYKMPKALCNRLLHFEIRSDYAAWRKWAVGRGIADKVVAYLAFDQSRLCVEPESSDMAYQTPRSWEFVSMLLQTVSDNPEEIHSLIAGCIGEQGAIEFEAFCRGTLDLPDMDDIFAGRPVSCPKRYDSLYALLSSMTKRLYDQAETLTLDEAENVCAFVMQLPADFVMSFVQDVQENKILAKKVSVGRTFQNWFLKNKHLMGGVR